MWGEGGRGRRGDGGRSGVALAELIKAVFVLVADPGLSPDGRERQRQGNVNCNNIDIAKTDRKSVV